MIFVLKRDGKTREPFDVQRITRCIMRATQNKKYVSEPELDLGDAKVLAHEVARDVEDTDNVREGNKCVGVEFIQELVIARLMIVGYPDTAKAYTIYRYERSLVRRSKGLKFILVNTDKGVVLRCPVCEKVGELDPGDAKLVAAMGGSMSLMELELKSDGQNLARIVADIQKSLSEFGFGSDLGGVYSVKVSVERN